MGHQWDRPVMAYAILGVFHTTHVPSGWHPSGPLQEGSKRGTQNGRFPGGWVDFRPPSGKCPPYYILSRARVVGVGRENRRFRPLFGSKSDPFWDQKMRGSEDLVPI